MSEHEAINYATEIETEGSRFCEGCPFRGQAERVLGKVVHANYPVGLRRTGAIGAVEDAEGGLSEPIDVPFKGYEKAEFRGGGHGPSEYWPDRLNLEIDEDGIIEGIGNCTGPEAIKTRFLRREVEHCPVLQDSLMSRNHRKQMRKIISERSSS